MSDPCSCHACVVAGVDRPSVTIPAFRGVDAHELHGTDLMRYYAAQDTLRATLARLNERRGPGGFRKVGQ